MEIVVASLGFTLAAACAAVMGFAIQRGTICTVVAVDELIEHGTARRLVAMAEAALWVTGGLLVAKAFGPLAPMPHGFQLTPWTMLGGAMLGLGAAVNGACAFGGIARLGSGDWAFLAMPVGFYLGCRSVPHLPDMPPQQLPFASPVLRAPGWLALVFLGFAAWRVLRLAVATGLRVRALACHAWSPHAAATIIGVTFVVSLLLVGAWSYTEALADLAHDMVGSLGGRILLLAGVLSGAVAGGWSARRLRHRPPTPAQLLRCLVGGALMAWGARLVPGSNDGLVLLGMPLLWPHAWAAFAAMCATIAATRVLRTPRWPAILRRGRTG